VRYGDAFSRTPFAKALDCPLSLPPGQSMLASHRPEKLRASGLFDPYQCEYSRLNASCSRSICAHGRSMMDWLFILVLWVAVGVSLVMWDAKRWDAVHRPARTMT
jgi:hypothetical protein